MKTFKSLKDGINEGVEEKVKIFDLYSQKFQLWIAENMGDVISKGSTRTFKNKAGVEVFSYDLKKEILTIIQKGLSLDQLKKYGLGK